MQGICIQCMHLLTVLTGFFSIMMFKGSNAAHPTNLSSMYLRISINNIGQTTFKSLVYK